MHTHNSSSNFTTVVILQALKPHKVIVHGLRIDVLSSLQNLMLGNITLGHLYFPVSVWEGREPPIPSHPARYMSTSPELGTQTGQDPKKDVFAILNSP